MVFAIMIFLKVIIVLFFRVSPLLLVSTFISSFIVTPHAAFALFNLTDHFQFFIFILSSSPTLVKLLFHCNFSSFISSLKNPQFPSAQTFNNLLIIVLFPH